MILILRVVPRDVALYRYHFRLPVMVITTIIIDLHRARSIDALSADLPATNLLEIITRNIQSVVHPLRPLSHPHLVLPPFIPHRRHLLRR